MNLYGFLSKLFSALVNPICFQPMPVLENTSGKNLRGLFSVKPIKNTISKIFSAIILSAFLLVFAACTPKTSMPGVSQEELWHETEKQRQLAAEHAIDKQFKNRKSRLKHEEMLNVVSSNILKGGVEICGAFNKDKSLCVYEFILLEKGPINAFADGNRIYITPAMMNFVKNEEELAYILGHEYAHNMMNHIGDMQFNVLAGAVVGALFDGLFSAHGADTRGQFTEAGAQAGRLSYSKEYEAEADYVGLYVATLAGYNVSNAPNFWRQMAVKEPESIYVGMTHPTSPERFIAMQKTVSEIEAKKKRGARLLPEIKKPEETVKAKTRN